ncbi:MAG: hypothetical protein AAGI71_10740 [Bacteroidota bacterium]
MYITFALLVAPILFFMVTWAVVTVYRLYFPEEPLPYDQDPTMLRRRATLQGHSVPVGVREIREDQRLRQHTVVPASYHYACDGSCGLPEAWVNDLWERRN